MKGKKFGVLLGYIAMFIQNISSFVLTPLLIIAFGNGNFGVYRLILSISSYFALADLGLSNAIVRYISEYRAKNDKISESRFVSLIVIIDIFVGSILMLGGFVIYMRLPIIFGSSFLPSELDLLSSLFFLTLINGVFNLFTNITTGIIKSYENFSFLKIINILSTFVRFGVALLLISLGKNAFAIVLLDTILSLLLLIITTTFCLINLKIKLSFKLLNRKYAKQILSYSIIVFIDAIAFHLFWNADNFIIGIFLSSSAIALYSIGTQISTLFFSLSIIVSDVIMPGIVAKVTNNATDSDLTDEMIKIGRIKLMFLALPVIGFIFLGKEFITFWVGVEFLQAYWIALLVIIPLTIAGVFDAGLYIMWAKNKHKVKSIVSLTIALLNILLSIILVQAIGIIGAAIGTAFAYIVGYNIFNTIYFHKMLGLNMYKFIKDTLKGVWKSILSISIFASLVTLNTSSNIFEFAFKVFIISMAYVLMIYKTGFNENERQMFSGIVKKSI